MSVMSNTSQVSNCVQWPYGQLGMSGTTVTLGAQPLQFVQNLTVRKAEGGWIVSLSGKDYVFTDAAQLGDFVVKNAK